MASKSITSIAFHIFLSLAINQPAKSQVWVKVGYWYKGTSFAASEINSALFTHLLCAFADLNSTSYELSIPPSNENKFSTFTETVKRKNPSVTTLLSIGGETSTLSTGYPLMASRVSGEERLHDITSLSLLFSMEIARKVFLKSAVKLP
ncbi:hypothetical protein Pint_14632 [Pistacia integerrima]|uniref:Uncharacterized protein n=1 Tax=Pistacia integerrima TaxID=434235 RepID=A0ACC0Y8F4_9ROSI|nr:hypothetical protein Pint_14632 [Pistacia integerrima]